MQNPTEQDLSDLKRLGRYLKSRPRVTTWFEPQKTPQKLTVFCEFRSCWMFADKTVTTGLAVMFGRHCVKHSSNIQSTVALSSGESEYYAATKACALGMSIQALLEDWDYSVELEVRTGLNSSDWHSESQRTRKTETCSNQVSLATRESI